MRNVQLLNLHNSFAAQLTASYVCKHSNSPLRVAFRIAHSIYVSELSGVISDKLSSMHSSVLNCYITTGLPVIEIATFHTLMHGIS